MNDYEKQAQEFLDRFGLSISIEKEQFGANPPWYEGGEVGYQYTIDIYRKPRHHLIFPFWDSVANKKRGAMPTAYDVLACISPEIYCPETFEDFCSEYGYDEDSRKAEKTWDRCLTFSRKIQGFFFPEELEALQEIQ